jgi:tetratricopeptide (TPR) repeat protein
MKPLCFVLMPFGRKPDSRGSIINFDSVYEKVISPAVIDARLEPIRADEEKVGGIIHKPMYERLILCEYAVADLTTANANVFYELGVRHAIRPWSTLLIFAEGGTQLPFDLAPMRAIPYQLKPDGEPDENNSARKILVDRLLEAQKDRMKDSPIFQMVEGFPDIQHLKTDVFRERVRYSEEYREKLQKARKQGIQALRNLVKDEEIKNLEAGVIIDIFLSYRDVAKSKEEWEEMTMFVNKMPQELVNTVMVQEQLGFALNRAGKRVEAEKILLDLIKKRGPSSETYGILGRVYKDSWESALNNGNKFLAKGYLDKAIDAYLKGFEADWRDAYPGINLVTLMEIRDPPDIRRLEIIPVVKYAFERKIASGKPDYWDYATQLELAVLQKDEKTALKALSDALSSVRAPWELETTGRNLRLIREARQERREIVQWTNEAEEVVLKTADDMKKEVNRI